MMNQMNNIEFEEIVNVSVKDKTTITFDKLITRKLNLKEVPFDPKYPNADKSYLKDEFDYIFLKNYIKNKKCNIHDIKTICINSTVTIPRIKIRLFCEKQNLVLTRNEKDANVILIGNTYFENLINYNYLTLYSKDFYLNFINSVQLDNLKGIPELRKALTNNINYVSSDYLVKNLFEYKLSSKKLDNFYDSQIKLDNICLYYFKNKENKSLQEIENDYKEMFNLNSKWYHEDSIITLVNEGNIIDKTVYENIRSMFESTDKANHVVAMEIMANSDYNKSFVYLSFLFKDYFNSKIHPSGKKNNVNFKSLIKFIKGEYKIYGLSFNFILDNLSKNNLLTESNYKLVKEALINELNNENHCDNYTITNVELSQKLQDNLIEDFKEVIKETSNIETL